MKAQEIFEGVVKDKDSGDNIAYVNIGILNKNVGTVSASNGKFSLPLDGKYDNETLKISIIGYKSVEFKVGDFKKKYAQNATIYLEKNVSELKEVVINGNLKTRSLGNKLGKKTVSAGFVNNVLGNEIGIVVKIKKKPTYVEAFHAMVDYNHYKELKFRLNFYDLKNGLPNNTILTENIIVTSAIKKGELTVDLSDYNIVAEEDFFVSLELIEGLGEGGLHFLADYDGSPIITRAVSQGKWNKQDDLSFGFSVTVKN
ncbi:carboxypeptidase-like regulatory domain-containing protein [Flavobacterium sp. 3HN19-14]|uniref:carboxypeptidase-like regulatory domain-containing protein n=1 Tax=Flavobacterium sp. 3HN19-14 TaxID=3448133 RepID=UPI003EE11FF0